jgi:hypothetical protein
MQKGDKFNYILECPHCKRLLGIQVDQTVSKEIPMFIGACRDCLHLEDLPTEIDGDGEKFVGWCALQGNVNPIHFKQSDLDKKDNPWVADGYEYNLNGKWVCLGFTPRPIQ